MTALLASNDRAGAGGLVLALVVLFRDPVEANLGFGAGTASACPPRRGRPRAEAASRSGQDGECGRRWTGLVAGAPIEIGACRSDDGGAGSCAIIRRRKGETRFPLSIGRLASMKKACRIHAPGRRRWSGPASTERPVHRRLAVVRQSGDPEEHIGAIAGAHLRGLVRMRGHPLADALRRNLRCETRLRSLQCAR